MPEQILVKLGGSVITDKAGECAPDIPRLARIAGDLVPFQDALLLVHGAGSCGHPQARQYGLDRGLLPGRVTGIYETHQAVSSLNRTVVETLRLYRVEALGISPLDLAVSRDGRLESFDTRAIALLREVGIVPVLHGDVVMDRTRGASILSGDQIVNHLARTLQIPRVGLATGVRGVLGPDGRVIPTLQSGEEIPRTPSSRTDVTGEMQGKVRELYQLAEQGIESHIFHVDRLRDFLEGRNHGGTVIPGRGS